MHSTTPPRAGTALSCATIVLCRSGDRLLIALATSCSCPFAGPVFLSLSFLTRGLERKVSLCSTTRKGPARDEPPMMHHHWGKTSGMSAWSSRSTQIAKQNHSAEKARRAKRAVFYTPSFRAHDLAKRGESQGLGVFTECGSVDFVVLLSRFSMQKWGPIYPVDMGPHF